MPTLQTSPSTTFTTLVRDPPMPKIPHVFAVPTVKPVLKITNQSLTTSMSNPTPGLSNPSTLQSQLRHASTVVPTSFLTTNPPTAFSSIPKPFLHSIPTPSSKPESPVKHRTLHTSKLAYAMLSDNVYLPSFTAVEAPIEIPAVPILPSTRRAAPVVEIEMPTTEHPIITAAGAHTYPAPPGRGADHTKEHLQSDSTKRRGPRAEEKQSGKFEGDWGGEAGAEGEDTHKFVPEEGRIPPSEKGLLWGVLGAATLWALFGPGTKKSEK